MEIASTCANEEPIPSDETKTNANSTVNRGGSSSPGAAGADLEHCSVAVMILYFANSLGISQHDAYHAHLNDAAWKVHIVETCSIDFRF